MFKNCWAVITCVTFVLSLAVCESGSSAATGQSKGTVDSGKSTKAKDPLQELYEKAKSEGVVNYWGPSSPEDMAPLIKAFGEKFPGIKVNTFGLISDALIARGIAESSQGKLSFDIAQSSLKDQAAFLERDLIQGFDDWTKVFKDLKEAGIFAKGKMLLWYNAFAPVVYNTSLLKPSELPTSWEDLLSPKWKGNIIVEPRGENLAYVGLVWGEEKMVDYAKKLAANQPIFVRSSTTVANQVVAGVAPIAIGTQGHKVLDLQKQGAPIDWLKFGPVGCSSAVVYVMKGASHPNAAKLFTGWLATPEAQKINTANSFKGPMYPGSDYVFAKEAEKYKVKLSQENSENYMKLVALNNAASRALGAMK